SLAFGLDGWRGVCTAGAVLAGVLIALWLASQRIGARQVAQ
ncbi:hypothetical protein B1M_02185, partial [Burkholderia sp. TJI49]